MKEIFKNWFRFAQKGTQTRKFKQCPLHFKSYDDLFYISKSLTYFFRLNFENEAMI